MPRPKFSPRRPDFRVKIAQDRGEDGKTRWYEVGSAWENDNSISLNIVTMPGVKIRLYPVDGMDEET